MTAIYDDRGIRFEYPDDWELEVTDDGPITTAAVQSPSGLAFALVTTDDSCPAPAEIADQALEAMREDYPTLDSAPAMESIGAHHAVGHDIEFLSLDMANSCVIRCFGTPDARSWCSANGRTWKVRMPRPASASCGSRSRRRTVEAELDSVGRKRLIS